MNANKYLSYPMNELPTSYVSMICECYLIFRSTIVVLEEPHLSSFFALNFMPDSTFHEHSRRQSYPTSEQSTFLTNTLCEYEQTMASVIYVLNEAHHLHFNKYLLVRIMNSMQMVNGPLNELLTSFMDTMHEHF